MLNGVQLNADGIKHGLWFALGKTELKIAHSSNAKFKAAIVSRITNGQMSVQKACAALAEGVLVDWRSLKHIDGSDVPYSVDMAAYALLTNKDLREFVERVSSDLENYEVDDGYSG